MYQSAYNLQISDGLVSHFPGVSRLLRDRADGDAASEHEGASEADELLMMARIRSGDYVATLATELDKLAQGLAVAHAPEAPQVERIVHELLYLDRRYRLVPRD